MKNSMILVQKECIICKKNVMVEKGDKDKPKCQECECEEAHEERR